jgi:D-alanine-D-alanine ligase
MRRWPMRVLLLYGGRSAEREISIESAAYVQSVLEDGCASHVIMLEIDSSGSWTAEGIPLSIETGPDRWKLLKEGVEIGFDIVFPVLHGPYGEDGTVQGLCATAGWPCAGADVLGSAIAMNKDTCKRLLAAEGIRVVPWQAFKFPALGLAKTTAERIGFPCFVKPARLGSSVGISRVTSPEDLPKAAELAFSYDSLIIIEKEVPDAREIEVSILGDSEGIEISVAGEIEPGKDWYDYEAKYDCADSKLLIPAQLDKNSAREIRVLAEEAFRAIGGTGFARVDFLISGDGVVFLNELNTIPGFTSISMFPKLWEASGNRLEKVLERIMTEALDRTPVGLKGGVR